MILHGGLQEIHAGKAINQILWCKQHNHCGAAADDDCVNKNAERLYKACFGRAVTFCGGSGYVVAIVEYRHSGIAHFPAQIIDAKNAVRFLRAHAEEYKLNPSQMFLMGDSSGGQVSSVAGMTAKSGKLDEPINEESCEVCGIIDLYGAVDVTLPYGYPITLNHQKPDSPEGMLMGYDITEHLEEAKAACSKTYVNEDFPPMLIAHGTKDTMVFCQQSVDLYHALKDAGKDVQLYLLRGADHGGAAFWTEEMITVYDNFFKKCLGE